MHIKMCWDVARTVFRRKCTHLKVFNKKKCLKRDIKEKNHYMVKFQNRMKFTFKARQKNNVKV